MRTLLKTRAALRRAERWDIDFHLPAEGIKQFQPQLLQRVEAVVTFPKGKRDPGKKPEESFRYIDISSIDVVTGGVVNPQELEGSEAPSRARKVVRAFDILVSTCRPTRGAIAVVPQVLHDQVASTGFSLLRAKPGVNPFFLHYALRLPSTLEQFRKWSTGSSYPAILDEDVAKTLIPLPGREQQDEIAKLVVDAMSQRDCALAQADRKLRASLDVIAVRLGAKKTGTSYSDATEAAVPPPCTMKAIQSALDDLPPLNVDAGGKQGDLASHRI